MQYREDISLQFSKNSEENFQKILKKWPHVTFNGYYKLVGIEHMTLLRMSQQLTLY